MSTRTLHDQEGLNADPDALATLVSSVGGDIRQVLNMLQMWKRSASSFTAAELKHRMRDIEKDKVSGGDPGEGMIWRVDKNRGGHSIQGLLAPPRHP